MTYLSVVTSTETHIRALSVPLENEQLQNWLACNADRYRADSGTL